MANTFAFDDEEPTTGESEPALAPETYETEKAEGSEGNNRTFLIAAIGLGGVVLLSLICMAIFALFILPGQKAANDAKDEANRQASAFSTNVSMETQVAALATATLAPTETPLPLPTETPVLVPAVPTSTPMPLIEPATATFEAMQTQVSINLLTAAPGSADTGTAVAGATKGTSGTAVAAVTASGASTAVTVKGASGTPAALLSAADITSTAAAQGTSTALGTPKMPASGFADGAGLPISFVVSILLVAVILLARRLRQSPMPH